LVYKKEKPSVLQHADLVIWRVIKMILSSLQKKVTGEKK